MWPQGFPTTSRNGAIDGQLTFFHDDDYQAYIYLMADSFRFHEEGVIMCKSNGRKLKCTVVVHKSKYGYHVECPALPGCVSQGESLKEALGNIKDAIRTYLMMIKKETRRRKTIEV